MAILFYDDAHEEFYNAVIERCDNDAYNRSLIYLIGLTEDTRRHLASIYDTEEAEINPEVLTSAWITSTSAIVLRLAFNLFNGYAGEDTQEKDKYCVDNIFCNTEFAPYFYEAVKLRFEMIK